jgi:long-chain acyl-CoA synthetase
LQRPAEKLSVTQNVCKIINKYNKCMITNTNTLALMLTGLIWSRYSMVIIPKNYSLFAVNLFVFGTGAMQVGRILK